MILCKVVSGDVNIIMFMMITRVVGISHIIYTATKQVQFVCKEADTTVAGTKRNTFTAFCGTSGTAIELKQCYPSCSVSSFFVV